MSAVDNASRPGEAPCDGAPLAGLRVVDLTVGVLGAVGRQLAELGADVTWIGMEDGGGSDQRLCAVDIEDFAASLGKTRLYLDLSQEADRARLDRLLEEADILIEDFACRSPGAPALDVADLCRRRPDLVVLSLSPFGASGSYRDWRATGPVLHALSGVLFRSGVPGRPPLLPPDGVAEHCAAAQAAFVALLAYWNRVRTGIGDHLDFSLLEGVTHSLDPAFGVSGSAMLGALGSMAPRERTDASFRYPVIACADGHVRLCVLAARQWRGLFKWMGEPPEFADPAFDLLQTRYQSSTLLPAIARCFAGKTRAELVEAGQRHGVPTAAVLNLTEALQTEQILARGALASCEPAPGITVPFPGSPLEIDGRRAGTWDRLPHSHGRASIAPAPVAGTSDDRPLSGLRVLDLGVIVVGAEQGRLLADQGAEVVKVENTAFPDGLRQNRSDSLMSQSFAAGQRNKKGLGLNLRDPAGKALFLRLVAQSDILLSNFKPGTLISLGLDERTLLAANPRIILADSSAYGLTGPASRRLGYGPLVRAETGLAAQWRYEGKDGLFGDANTVYPDHVAARIGMTGVLALLIRRLRTGRGGTVSVAQAEIILRHLGARLATSALIDAGKMAGIEGRHDAPWGVYRCAGEDEWCVVTIDGDEDWRALCREMERDDLAADSALADKAGRDRERGRIDGAVRDWLVPLAAETAMTRLQKAGIAAAAMLCPPDLPDFPFYTERGFFRSVHHPAIDGPVRMENAPVRSDRLPDPPACPAPMMGEHSVAIMREWLDMPESEIARLIEAGVLQVPGINKDKSLEEKA